MGCGERESDRLDQEERGWTVQDMPCFGMAENMQVVGVVVDACLDLTSDDIEIRSCVNRCCAVTKVSWREVSGGAHCVRDTFIEKLNLSLLPSPL